jgi:glc operon protein GlcG
MRVHKLLPQLLLAAGIAVFSLNAAAQARPDYGVAIEAPLAKKIAAAALAECAKNKWNIAIAIVDNHGGLVYYERMLNTQTASFDIAVMKARAAATYRRPTRAWADVIGKDGAAATTLPGVVASPGGLPILQDGKVIGGIGASGVTGDQDEQCSKAGLAAM